MSYSEGFDALQEGAFEAAVSLLEQAATASGFTSEIVNHAYTLALYRAGHLERLADVAFKVGQEAAAPNPGLALDYFQRALIAGLDSERIRKIGALHEQWAEETSSRRPASGGAIPGERILRIAHVVGDWQPGTGHNGYVRLLSEGLRAHGITSKVFSTEWAASWFFNPPGIDQPDSTKPHADVWLAPHGDDFLSRARAVAHAMAEYAPDVALYHSSFFEQITARVAGLRPAPLQVHINHDREIDADLFDARAHRSLLGQTESRRAAGRISWIPVASDVETRLQAEVPVSRRSMGMDTAASVSATFGNLDRICSPAYVATLTEILVRFPNHCHLFAGQGNVRSARQTLHAEGVLPRVRFLGPTGDVAPLLSALDFYLAPFPNLDRDFILDAMGAGKPVVIYRKASDLNGVPVDDIVGEPDLVADSQSAYVEAVSRIIRKSELRQTLSESMRRRFTEEHSPAAMARRYINLFEQLSAR